MKPGQVITVRGYKEPFIVLYLIKGPVLLVRCRDYYSDKEYEFPEYKIENVKKHKN